MVYSPLDCLEQYSAAFWNEPPGWLPAHQFSVTVPLLLLLSPPPHAATTKAAATSARTEVTRLDMTSGPYPGRGAPNLGSGAPFRCAVRLEA